MSFILVLGQLADAQKFQYEIFSKNGSELKYRILFPEDFDAKGSYPVILFLHGAGERGDDNEKQLVIGGEYFIDTEFREKYKAVVIFPQCPRESFWSNAKWSEKRGKLIYRQGGKSTQPMGMALALIDSIVSLDYSKNNQIYLGGLSMGGMGTFEMLARRPNMFAAAFPICGGGFPGNAEKYAKTALWVFHGMRDDVIKPYFSTEMVLAMQKAKGDVRYSLYPEVYHNSWDNAFAEDELFPWLFSKKRGEE